MCERTTSLSSLFTAVCLQDQIAHRMSLLMGSMIRKGELSGVSWISIKPGALKNEE